MRELVVKDMLAMGRTLKVYALFLSAYLVLALLGMFDPTVVLALIPVVVLMLPVGAFVSGESEGQELFPKGRSIVAARYILVLFSIVAGGSLGFFTSVFLSAVGPDDWTKGMAVVTTSLGAAVLLVDILLPLYYHLGQERAQSYLRGILFAAMIALFGAFRFDAAGQERILGRSTLFLLFSLAGLGVSFLISCRLAERKNQNKKRTPVQN